MDDSGSKSAKKGSKLSRTWNKFRHKIKSPKEEEESAARHATPAYRPQSSYAAEAPAGTTARTSPTRKTPSSAPAPAPARKPAHAADALAVFEKVSDLCPALQQLDQDLVGVSGLLLEFDRLHERVEDMHKRLASVPWQEFAVAESGIGDASAEEVAWEQVLPHLLEAMESVADAEAADAEFDSPALDASLETARRALDAAAPGLRLAPPAAVDAWSELDERCCAVRLSRRSRAERGAWAPGGEQGSSALASLAAKVPSELFAAGVDGAGGELPSAEALPPALLAALAACELDLAALALEGARSPVSAAAALGQALSRVADAAEASDCASPDAAWALLELAAALSWRAFAQCRQARALARAHAALLACLGQPGRLALRRVADREWRRRLGQILRQRALKIAAMLRAEMSKEVAALAGAGEVPEPAGEWDQDSRHFPSASYVMQELEEAVTTSLFVPGHSCCPELLITYALDLSQSYASFLVACVRPLLEGAAAPGPVLEARPRRALALLAVALVQTMTSVPVPQLLGPVCDSAQLEWVAQALESVVVAVARELGLELNHGGGGA